MIPLKHLVIRDRTPTLEPSNNYFTDAIDQKLVIPHYPAEKPIDLGLLLNQSNQQEVERSEEEIVLDNRIAFFSTGKPPLISSPVRNAGNSIEDAE